MACKCLCVSSPHLRARSAEWQQIRLWVAIGRLVLPQRLLSGKGQVSTSGIREHARESEHTRAVERMTMVVDDNLSCFSEKGCLHPLSRLPPSRTSGTVPLPPVRKCTPLLYLPCSRGFRVQGLGSKCCSLNQAVADATHHCFSHRFPRSSPP